VAETTFLTTGATGATGGAAAALLLDKKRRVRVLAHREDDRSKRLEELGAEVDPSPSSGESTANPAPSDQFLIRSAYSHLSI
jgi:NADPH:quinone reductase-like Zn-dependent oxidoreductase